MKKKVLAVLLGGCMVVGMLAGCGSKANETKTTDEATIRQKDQEIPRDIISKLL